MNLAELLDGIVDQPLHLKADFMLTGLALDSRKIKPGFAFIAVSGAVEHGLVYVQEAIENGAIAVIYDPWGSNTFDLNQLNIVCLPVTDLAKKLGLIANRFYQQPSLKVDVIGLTGTNGKTSCSQFLAQALSDSAVIGTLGWGEPEALKTTVNTTPDALAIQGMLSDLVDAGKRFVVMEVSSHGLQQGRVNEVFFKAAVFTNLSRDHLDYHGDMENYLQAKLLLFKQPGLQFVVVNNDDPYSERFLAVVEQDVKKWGFSVSGRCNDGTENVCADEVEYTLDGIRFLLQWKAQNVRVQSQIVGDFNLENILAVVTVLLAEGNSLARVVEKIAQLRPVKGRMEHFGGDNKPHVFVDYAHTPDALEKVLAGLGKHCQDKLRLVFGCGGNRDKGKRAMMGLIAEQYADYVIISNDNPRFENEDEIIADILAECSMQKSEVIKDRGKAIKKAIEQADKKDCIVIAGKGHEEYQDVMGVKNWFSDQEVVKQALQQWTVQQ